MVSPRLFNTNPDSNRTFSHYRVTSREYFAPALLWHAIEVIATYPGLSQYYAWFSQRLQDTLRLQLWDPTQVAGRLDCDFVDREFKTIWPLLIQATSQFTREPWQQILCWFAGNFKFPVILPWNAGFWRPEGALNYAIHLKIEENAVQFLYLRLTAYEQRYTAIPPMLECLLCKEQGGHRCHNGCTICLTCWYQTLCQNKTACPFCQKQLDSVQVDQLKHSLRATISLEICACCRQTGSFFRCHTNCLVCENCWKRQLQRIGDVNCPSCHHKLPTPKYFSLTEQLGVCSKCHMMSVVAGKFGDFGRPVCLHCEETRKAPKVQCQHCSYLTEVRSYQHGCKICESCWTDQLCQEGIVECPKCERIIPPEDYLKLVTNRDLCRKCHINKGEIGQNLLCMPCCESAAKHTDFPFESRTLPHHRSHSASSGGGNYSLSSREPQLAYAHQHRTHHPPYNWLHSIGESVRSVADPLVQSLSQGYPFYYLRSEYCPPDQSRHTGHYYYH